MGKLQRQEIITKLEGERGGRLFIAYVTSTRTNHELPIADDILPRLHKHLHAGREKAKVGVDLFLHSNGGSGTTPWRIVNLIREYTANFAVLVPHHAFSAATLIALGADSILMHKMGCLGPIDPSVANIFNPPHPQNPGQLAPISVEDVTAYFKLIKEDIGVQHEDELVQAILALTAKVHPLALGNVQRSHNQSRMIARKLLKKHTPPEQEHEIDTIVDNLKSNLYFHGHPINRHEAKEDLKLKVDFPDDELEELIWALYLDYEDELRLAEPFNPLRELDLHSAEAANSQLTTQQILAQIAQLQQAGIQLGGPIPEDRIVKLAVAMVPYVQGTASGASAKIKLEKVKGAYLESLDHTDVFLSDLTIERVMVNTPAGPQEATKQEPRWQRWEQEP